MQITRSTPILAGAILWLLLSLVAASAHAQTNLALSGTASASTADLPASNAIDGNMNSRWASAAQTDPSHITVDLGQAYALSQVVIHWEAANAAHYEIRGSNNGSSWTTLATRTGGQFGHRTDTVDVSGTYRYVRMHGISRSAGNSWGYSIWEFEVYGQEPSSGGQSVTIQAEDYDNYHDTTPGNTGGAYRSDGVDIEVTTDTGGGYNVGWIVAGEWLEYNVTLVAGSYELSARVASDTGGGGYTVLVNGNAVGSNSVGNTGGWQSWITQSVGQVNIPSTGTYTIRVNMTGGNFNLNWLHLDADGTSPPPPAVNVRVEAEDYDNYHDTTVGNTGGAYRNDNVDIEPTTDTGGGYNVGWIAAGEWLEYNISLNPGTYHVSARVASQTGGGNYTVLLNGNAIGSNSVGNTGGWQSWITQSVGEVNVTSAGTYTLRVNMNAGNFNLNWINLDPDGSTPPGRQLVWSDEFNSINLNNWTFEVGGHGWGNYELQYYTNGHNASIQHDAQIGSNVLVLEATPAGANNYQCWYGTCQYTSTRMMSLGKQEFTYGRMEARIRLPSTQGIWPAFWMMGNNFHQVGWPHNGELDIMEHVGFEPHMTHGALHGPGYSGLTPINGSHNLGERADARYRVYAVEWTPDGISWYVDDHNFYNITRAQVEQYGAWVYNRPFFFLLNVAVGGSWPGSPDGSSQFPQRMYVDYVRVYQ